MRLEDYDQNERFTATVVSSERITPPESTDEIRELVLDVAAPDLDVDAGQSLGVLAPGQKEFGQKHHFRLYTIADLPEKHDGKARVKIAVKRCSYVDEYNGEEYQGVASNYLCNLKPGDTITMAGPYGLAFEVPDEMDANLVLIGAGTGIAPFRAFLKHIYHNVPDFVGKVLLLHGARSGLELLYQNDELNDFSQYYDSDTFEAIAALSPRPGWTDDIDWEGAMARRGEELWRLLGDPKTYVYVAGLEPIRDRLNKVFAKLAGGDEKWDRRKAELVAGRRWVELLY